MAQVLVTKISEWYQGIASLKNLSEKKLEMRFLKCASQIFKGYHSFQSAYTFESKVSTETAGPDVILIAEDFSQWVIVEVELAGKPLAHTKKQLRVFTNAKYDLDGLVTHCIKKEPKLAPNEKKLKKLLENNPPYILVVFDTYHKTALQSISTEFDCKVCVLEVYRTMEHDFELYRMSGDYPYVYTEFCYLKNVTTNPDMYTISRPELFNSIAAGDIEVFHKNQSVAAKLMKSSKQTFLKIPENPFPPGSDLKIFKSFADKLILEKL